MKITRGVWYKSSYSCGANNCVEVRPGEDTVEVRDSKDQGNGPVLAFSAEAWSAFLPVASAACNGRMLVA